MEVEEVNDELVVRTDKRTFKIWNPNVEDLLKGGKSMETFNKVKSFRVGAKITQEKMADALGITTRTYQSKENGNADWRLSEMNKFVEVINENTGSTYTAADIFF